MQECEFRNESTASVMSTYKIQMKECNDIKLGEQNRTPTDDLLIKDKLRICQEKLMNRYKNENAYMTSFLWSEDNDFPIREGFVDVKLHKTDMFGRKTGEIIQVKDIFAKESKFHRTVLITGDPGYGKTTICKKIAYDWGMDEESRSYLKSFDILIFIQLSELGEKSIIDAVIECIDDKANRQFAKKLRETEWNFLIILDGFNETRDKDCVKQFISNDSFEISVQMTIIVTSRPHVSDEIRKLIEYRCYIEGFTPEQKEKYIDFIVRDEDKCEYLKNIIKNNRSCFELAKCPFMLYMLCCLPKSKSDRYVMTNADVFMLIFRLIIEKYKKKENGIHNLKRGKYFDGEDLIIKLGKVYYVKEFLDSTKDNGLETRKVKEKDLHKAFSKEECQFFLDLYIFVKRTAKDNGEYFDFIHRLFTEFIMAFYIFDSIDVVTLPEVDGILFFILGLFRDNPFAGNFINFLRRIFLHPVTWLNFYNEIKNERNKQLFCAETKLVFYFDCLDEFLKLSNICKFNRIYFCIPDRIDDWKNIKKELIKFHSNLNYSHDFQICVLLDRRFSDDPATSSNSVTYIDLYESVKFLKYLFESYSWDKFQFYFYGIVCNCNTEYSIICDRNIDSFRKIEENVTEEINEEFNRRGEKPVVLCNESESGDDQKYLMSEDQYNSLLPYFMKHPLRGDFCSVMANFCME
ncbi:uncharacterized protein LOC111634692 isoform X1 [Centruroides sculpturatus]|uniref:uncharacterized protein LOC111634692 isoform X1 n=3 Tax=Centruroides sculpturatus TaxID=218467 RepID=UPI000C6E0F77|nr:uncharacterized protein LOC111634692 isoform X1 [Centruroides sculpturatus]